MSTQAVAIRLGAVRVAAFRIEPITSVDLRLLDHLLDIPERDGVQQPMI